MLIRHEAPPILRQTIGYSVPDRCRALEISTYPLDDPADERRIKYYGRNGAKTQGYVVAINRKGVTPNAGIRDPREPFAGSDTIQHVFSLSEKPGAAQAHLIGAVTGPYVAGENDWHGMFLVTREEKHVPTFGALHAEEMTQLHSLIERTLRFMKGQNPDATRFVGFSFSPLENLRRMDIAFPDGVQEALFPRSPVQNLATIHAHAVMMDARHIKPHPVSDKPFDQRMVQEPHLERLLDIFTRLVFDSVQREFPDIDFGYAQHTDADERFPKGGFITISSQALSSPRMGEFMRRLHQQYEDVYWRIADTVADKRQLMSGRVTMRSPEEAQARITALLQGDEFRDLPEATKRFLRLLRRLKNPDNIFTPQMPMQERAARVEEMVLLGPSYNVLYYQPNTTQVTIAIVPRWLSGASPLETAGVFKDQQSVDQAAFEPSFSAHKTRGRRLVEYLTHAGNTRRSRKIF